MEININNLNKIQSEDNMTSCIFIIKKKGNWVSNKTRFLFLDDQNISYYVIPSEKEINNNSDYNFISKMTDKLTTKGNIGKDLMINNKPNTLNFLKIKHKLKEKDSISINDLDKSIFDQMKKEENKTIFLLTDRTKKKKWNLDFIDKKQITKFISVFNNIINPPQEKLENEAKKMKEKIKEEKIKEERNQNKEREKKEKPKFLSKTKTIKEEENKNEIPKKNPEDFRIEIIDKILHQEIFFQNLFRLHNNMLAHLNCIANTIEEIKPNNPNNNNTTSNQMGNPEFFDQQEKKINRKNTPQYYRNIREFTLEIEWLILEAYSLFKNFCIGTAKKLIHEFPIENGQLNNPGSKIVPFMVPAYEKIKTPKCGAFFYYLKKMNIHFTITWDKVSFYGKEKDDNKINRNNENHLITFLGKWKKLGKEFKNRDLFFDLINMFNSKSSKIQKFPAIPMTCIVDYHGFRIYCESIVPRGDHSTNFSKRVVNPYEGQSNNNEKKNDNWSYYEICEKFSNDFNNLDSERVEEDYFIPNKKEKEKDENEKERKAKINIDEIENLYILKTKELHCTYNLKAGNKNPNNNNQNHHSNDKKLLNDNLEKMTRNYYKEIEDKMNNYISLLKDYPNNNYNNFNNSSNYNETMNNMDNMNKNLIIDYSFLEEDGKFPVEELNGTCDQDNSNVNNPDNSGIMNTTQNANMQNNNRINNKINFPGKEFMKNLSKFGDSNNNLISDIHNENPLEDNFEQNQESDFRDVNFLEEIFQENINNYQEMPNNFNNMQRKNPFGIIPNNREENLNEKKKEIYDKIFTAAKLFNKNRTNPKDEHPFVDDIFIYLMKYNFLLRHTPKSSFSEKSNKEEDKFQYHYYRPEYMFYYFKNYLDNIENSKNTSDDEKNFKKKIGEDFIYFMKEILMHSGSDSKMKNLEEFKNFFKEKHIYYFTNSLESLMTVPIDSEQLTEIFHANGINMFNLGKVAELTTVPHIRELCIIEIIARICKRFINQILSSRKLYQLSRNYNDKIYDVFLNSNNKEKGNRDKEQEKEKNRSSNLGCVSTTTFFKYGGNQNDFENLLETNTNKNVTRAYSKNNDITNNYKYLLSEPYNSGENLFQQHSNKNNNDENLAKHYLPSYSNTDELKEVSQFLNVLFNLKTKEKEGNNNINNQSTSMSNNNPQNNYFNNDGMNMFNNNNNNSQSIYNNDKPKQDEIEIMGQLYNHDKLWKKIIEQIKKKFFLENEYILQIIKNQYFSLVALFHAILYNSGLKFVGEAKNICEDIHAFSKFSIEFRDSIFQVKPKVKALKFRNFYSSKAYKNTRENIFDDSFDIDHFRSKKTVKNMIFRNFLEHVSYNNTDFVEFALIFYEGLNRIPSNNNFNFVRSEKFDSMVFENTITNLLKKYDKERNISSSHSQNQNISKGLSKDTRFIHHFNCNFYKFNSTLIYFYYKLHDIRETLNNSNTQNTKISTANVISKNYKNKIKNFYYDNYYFQGIADLIFARIYYKKNESIKNDKINYGVNAMNSYMSALKNFTSTLGNKNIFVANVNYEIGKILANNENSNFHNIKSTQIIIKAIYYYTTAYEIYLDHKEKFWGIYSKILWDLWHLNLKMNFKQVALKYGNELLNDYEKFEKNLKENLLFRKLAFENLTNAENLSKNSDALEICKKIFDNKLYEGDYIDQYSSSSLHFFERYFKFIISYFSDTDERMLSIYADWVAHYKSVFDEGKNDFDKSKLQDIISDIEKGEIKDFKNYFEMLLNYFNNNIMQNISSNVDIRNDPEEKIKNLRIIYLLFKEQI